MVKFLLKKSYSRKDLKEKEFKDLWNAHGVFTTMWIYGKPQKILFFKEHITNLIKSTKNYKIYDRNLKRNIFKIIKSNLNKQKNYNHLLRIAVTKSLISISLRDKLKIKKNLQLMLVNYNRIKPEHTIEMSKLIQDSQLEVVKGAPHFGILKRKKHINAVVDHIFEFL